MRSYHRWAGGGKLKNEKQYHKEICLFLKAIKKQIHALNEVRKETSILSGGLTRLFLEEHHISLKHRSVIKT